MKTVSIAAMIMVLLGLAATIALFAFEEGLNHAGCNLDAAALGVLAACIVACIMGFVSFRDPAGKVAAILGVAMVAFFAYQFLRTSGPSQSSPAPMPPRAAARLENASLKEVVSAPRQQAPIHREVVVVTPPSPVGNSRFEGFRDLRVISTGPASGPIDNQNYQLYVGGYVGPFIGPGGYQWAGRHRWPGPHAGSELYLRYATPPHDEPGNDITIYGSGE